MEKERPELAAKIESVFQSTIEEIFEKMGMKKT
jgi:hypothetical protein